ncbi:MAG: hypothetical protein GY929_09005 [Actinomycetia bacterium]|nr:hypothetical protein [Actinomycetes bacterium]
MKLRSFAPYPDWAFQGSGGLASVPLIEPWDSNTLLSGAIQGGVVVPNNEVEIGSLWSAVRNTAAAGGTVQRMGIYELAADGSGLWTLVGSTAHDATLWGATTSSFQRNLEQGTIRLGSGVSYAMVCLFVGATPPMLYTGAASFPVVSACRNAYLNAGIVPATIRLTGQVDLPVSFMNDTAQVGSIPFMVASSDVV